MILLVSISVIINIFLVSFLLVSKIGQDAWRRWRNKQKHKKGGYVNTLMITKDGVIKEVFAKVKEGKFYYDDKPYIRVSKMRMTFRDLPTFLHREDQPSPIDVFDKDDDVMSCAEMDNVMNAQQNFDFRQWLSSILPFILIGVVILIIVLGVSAYFNYSVFQMLRDGTFKAVQVAATPITGAV